MMCNILLLLVLCISSLFLTIYSLDIQFDNGVDCSKEICNFNNDTLWIGGVVPGLNDTAFIDYSNSTFNGNENESIQIITIPVGITIELVSLFVTGPQLQFKVNGVLEIKENLNLTQSNFTISSDQSNSSSQLSNILLIDSYLLIDSIQSETNFQSLNGTALSVVVINENNNFTVQENNNNDTEFIVGTLSLEIDSKIVLFGQINIQEVQSLGQIELLNSCSLVFGPSKDGISEINSIKGIFSMDSQLEFNDDTVINNFEISQLDANSYTQITFYQSVQINNSPNGLENTIITVPQSSFFQESSTLNLGQSGGLIITGDAEITNNLIVGDVGISIKAEGTVTTSQIEITGDINVYQGSLNSNSTTFFGNLNQDSGNINFLGHLKVIGDFNQTLNSSPSLTFTNVLNNQTIPTLEVTGIATLSGYLKVSIKNEFKQNFQALLMVAGKIQGNFTKYQILTFGSNKVPTFNIKDSEDGKSQELWLTFTLPIDTPKQKLPSYQIVLIVIGALCSIFLIFFIFITIHRFIKQRSSSVGYTAIVNE